MDLQVVYAKEKALTEQERAYVLSLGSEDDAEEIEAMLAQAEQVAAPRAVLALCGVEIIGEDVVRIDDVEVTCRLMAQNFAGLHRVFPYVMSCSTELEEWSHQYAADPLAEYWADEIKKIYLGHAAKTLTEYVKQTYGIEKVARMNPGSLKDWPITGQTQLFAMLGREEVLEKVGVTLTDSMLMLPSKSGSGIYFETETSYENCQHCPRKTCPNRRAEFIGETGFVS